MLDGTGNGGRLQGGTASSKEWVGCFFFTEYMFVCLGGGLFIGGSF